uniref:UPAR/Ly6 domain-containing protein n=1 Tax=Leptobrachium leishanense TaxID=445787 RepID=A0A8C5R919_9ANUR
MRTFLNLICIFAASVTSGNGILCPECFNSTTANCEGSLATCASCQTVVAESGHGNNSVSVIEKSCSVYPDSCNFAYSVTASDFHISFNSSCCDTELCNNGSVQVLPRNTTENGLECPSCFMENATECCANQTVQCTGQETKCVNFTGSLFDQGSCRNYTLQACVTENVCKSQVLPLYPKTQLCEVQRVECSDPKATSPIS